MYRVIDFNPLMLVLQWMSDRESREQRSGSDSDRSAFNRP